MKDDVTFSGTVSEASECNPEFIGDKVPLRGGVDDLPDSTTDSPKTLHWTLTRTHLISKQLLALMGPHMYPCVKSTAASKLDSAEAFQDCAKTWASSPLFWKNGYCGRLAALRYKAPAPGSWGSSSSSSPYSSEKERRGMPPSPEEFEEFYRLKQQEREQEAQRFKGAGQDSVDDNDSGAMSSRQDDRGKEASWRLQDLTSSSGPSTRWVVASGLTQPEDFTLVYQSLENSERKEAHLDDDPDYYA